MNGLAFAPESLIIPVMERVMRRTATTFDLKLERIRDGVSFTVNRKADFDYGKMGEYRRSIDDIVCKMHIAVFGQVIRKVLDLPDPPAIRVISDEYLIEDFRFEYHWERRATSLPLRTLAAIAALCGMAIAVDAFLRGGLGPWIGAGFALVAGGVALVANASYHRRRSRFLEEKLVNLVAEYNKQLENLKTDSIRLMAEKNSAINRLRITEVYTRRSIVRLIENGLDPTGMKPETRSFSVLFSDIRDFTKLAEENSAIETVRLLNGYFDLMNRSIGDHHGEIDKLIGDCIMALFADPVSSVAAAMDMRANMGNVNEALGVGAGRRIRNGIGINWGEVIIGNIGSESKMDYTVIGDIVNSASRFESLTRHNGTGVIISEDLERQVSGHFEIYPLDVVHVKGKTGAIAIFEVTDYMPERVREIKRKARPDMEAAFAEYRSGDFEVATRLYAELRARLGPHAYETGLCADPVVDCFLERCVQLADRKKKGLLEGWDGVYNFLTK